MDKPEFLVDSDNLARWSEAAIAGRVTDHVLGQIDDPADGSPFTADDAAYDWDRYSDWMRQYLLAAADHMLLWANIVQPLHQPDGMSVTNPPRPYFTLARAALESACQAVWAMTPGDSVDRVHRHLRLAYHDLRQLNLGAIDLDQTETAAARMGRLLERVVDRYEPDSIKKAEPRYSDMVTQTASAGGFRGSELLAIWRGSSAAAHGKRWFQHYGYSAKIGEEYGPGTYRAVLVPEATQITDTVSAASRMLQVGVLRYAGGMGYDYRQLYELALREVADQLPRKAD